MRSQNGILEDISAEIGYTATTTLIDYLGGTSLYVPQEATAGHVIAKLIGLSAAKRLTLAYGNEVLNLPFDYRRERNQRNRLIGALIAKGTNHAEIARIAGISTKQVGHVRVELEQVGLLPMLIGIEDLFLHEPNGIADPKEFDLIEDADKVFDCDFSNII